MTASLPTGVIGPVQTYWSGFPPADPCSYFPAFQHYLVLSEDSAACYQLCLDAGGGREFW